MSWLCDTLVLSIRVQRGPWSSNAIKETFKGDTDKLAVGGVCSPKIYNNKGNSDRASSLGRKSFELLTIPGPWSPRPPRSSSGGPPETSPGVLSKKEVRLWQLHVQCAVKPPHCTSQLFRRKPLFCVETKEPFFSAHKFFCRRGTSQYFQAVAQSTTSLAPLYLVHYDTHFTILWLDAGLFWRNLYRTKVEVNNAIMTTNENHDQPFLF